MRAIIAAVLWAGCYAPHPQAGSPCATGVCPDGLVCSPATATCELTAVPPHDASPGDTRHDDGRPLADAAGDASLVDAAPRDAVLVQQATAHVDTGPTVAATLPHAPQTGNVLVMVGANPSGPITTVSGGGVVTWMLIAVSTTNANVEVWAGVSDGSDGTVAIDRPGSSSSNTIWLGEWSGLVTPVIVDGEVVMAGTTSPATTAGGTTSTRDLVLFAVGDGVPNAYGAPAPGTWSDTMSIVSQSVWYQSIPAGTVVDPSVSETAHQWDAALVGLQLAP